MISNNNNNENPNSSNQSPQIVGQNRGVSILKNQGLNLMTNSYFQSNDSQCLNSGYMRKMGNLKRQVQISNQKQQQQSNQMQQGETYSFNLSDMANKSFGIDESSPHKANQTLLKIIIKSVKNQKYYKFKKQELALINDKAHQAENTKKNSCFAYFCDKLVQSYKKSKVMQPDNKFLICWELLVIFELSYGNQSSYIIIFGYTAILIFLIDLIMNFHKAVYIKGILIEDKLEITKNYLKNTFIYDLLTIVCLILVQLFDSEWFEFGFIFMFIQMKTKLDNLNQYFQIKHNFGYIYDFIILISLVLLIAHLGGCGFYQIGRYDNFHKGKSWIEVYKIGQYNLWEKYIISIYFTFISMITVGYGDITPTTTNERIYVILMALISTGIFGYCVNNISQIFSQINQKRRNLEQQQETLTSYCKKRQISPKILQKMLKNIEFQNQNKNHEVNMKGMEILKKLDNDIYQEYKLEFFGSLLKKTRLFYQNFSSEAIKNCSFKMEELILSKGDTLFNENKKVDNLYILVSGKEGNVLALTEFLGEQNYEISAKCLTDCRLACLSQKNFIKIIQKRIEDYQKFIELRDQILINNKKFSSSSQFCQFCKDGCHLLKECQNLHLKVNKQIVIFKHQYSTPQERGKPKKEQRTKQKEHVFIDLERIQHSLKEVRLDFVYAMYGFELSKEQEDIFLFGQDQHSYDNIIINGTSTKDQDRKFFETVPRIKHNKIDSQKYEMLQELHNKLEHMQQNNNDNADDLEHIWKEINQQLEEQSEVSFGDLNNSDVDCNSIGASAIKSSKSQMTVNNNNYGNSCQGTDTDLIEIAMESSKPLKQQPQYMQGKKQNQKRISKIEEEEVGSNEDKKSSCSENQSEQSNQDEHFSKGTDSLIPREYNTRKNVRQTTSVYYKQPNNQNKQQSNRSEKRRVSILSVIQNAAVTTNNGSGKLVRQQSGQQLEISNQRKIQRKLSILSDALGNVGVLNNTENAFVAQQNANINNNSNFSNINNGTLNRRGSLFSKNILFQKTNNNNNEIQMQQIHQLLQENYGQIQQQQYNDYNGNNAITRCKGNKLSYMEMNPQLMQPVYLNNNNNNNINANKHQTLIKQAAPQLIQTNLHAPDLWLQTKYYFDIMHEMENYNVHNNLSKILQTADKIFQKSIQKSSFQIQQQQTYGFYVPFCQKKQQQHQQQQQQCQSYQFSKRENRNGKKNLSTI